MHTFVGDIKGVVSNVVKSGMVAVGTPFDITSCTSLVFAMGEILLSVH